MDKSPDAFKTISEVADDLDLPQHVLRFWETRFSQIKPLKRGGGRRYYRPDDIDLLRGIRHFLYGEGYTIKGLQRILKEEGIPFVQSVGRGETVPSIAAPIPEEFPGETEFVEEERLVLPESGLKTEQGSLFSSLSDGSQNSGQKLSKAQITMLRAALDDLRECERVLSSVQPAENVGFS